MGGGRGGEEVRCGVIEGRKNKVVADGGGLGPP